MLEIQTTACGGQTLGDVICGICRYEPRRFHLSPGNQVDKREIPPLGPILLKANNDSVLLRDSPRFAWFRFD
jgi:hypothetical protein